MKTESVRIAVLGAGLAGIGPCLIQNIFNLHFSTNSPQPHKPAPLSSKRGAGGELKYPLIFKPNIGCDLRFGF